MLTFFFAKTLRFDSLSSAKAQAVDEESEYQGSRYKPLLKAILEGLCNNSLDIEEYPSVLPLPAAGSSTASGVTSARSRKPRESARTKGGATSRWKRTEEPTKAKGAVYSGGRQIVFMVGGMSFGELTTVEAMSKSAGVEIVAGATHFLKPAQFMKDLGKLSK